MTGFRLFTSNKLETLTELLGDVLSSPISSPFKQENIVVQSKGMERWLSFKIASRFGILANAYFPLPGKFINDLFLKVLPDISPTSIFKPEILTWRIMKLLAQYLKHKEFSVLKTYLGHNDSYLKRFGLASRIANIFDKYLLLRPEMMLAWELGEKHVLHGCLHEEHVNNLWQPLLWQALVKLEVKEKEQEHERDQDQDQDQDQKYKHEHIAGIKKRFLEKINSPHFYKSFYKDTDTNVDTNADKNVDKNIFPERVSIFGMSMLPPFYLEIFSSLSRYIEVNFFILNPCRKLLSCITTQMKTTQIETAQKTGKTGEPGKTEKVNKTTKTPPISANIQICAPAKHKFKFTELDRGNSLVASMIEVRRDFFYLILNMNFKNKNILNKIENRFIDPITEITEPNIKPNGNTLLSYIQSDILNLINRKNEKTTVSTLSASDNSIQIHSCHSPMREVEVLKDQLLAMLDNDPELSPKDILVMSPDIENYAPFIKAVFGGHAKPLLPFNLSGKSTHKEKESRIINTFMSILTLHEERFGIIKVLAILETESVMQKFKINIDDLETIKKWGIDTSIKWGIDSNERKAGGLPPYPENTWKAGLHRLLLGYAMLCEKEEMFKGILPYKGIEQSEIHALGALMQFTEKLFSYAKEFKKLNCLTAWGELLNNMLLELFSSDSEPKTRTKPKMAKETFKETAKEFLLIKSALNSLAEKETLSGFHDKFEIDVIRSFLSLSLIDNKTSMGFLTGGITFSELSLMRSIPLKVICLLGMNDSAFPGKNRPLDFDLTAKEPHAGDPSQGHDDRYLFLETLLSARKILYISYVGQSIQDNNVYPPSVLVSELIDTIEEGFTFPNNKGATTNATNTTNINTNAPNNITNNILTKHKLQAFSPAYFKERGQNKKDKSLLFSYSQENFHAGQALLADKKEKEPFLLEELPEQDEEFKTVSLEELCSFFSNPVRYFLNYRLGLYLTPPSSEFDEREPFELKGLELYKLKQELLEIGMNGEDMENYYPVIRAKGILPHGKSGEILYKDIKQEVCTFVKSYKKLNKGREFQSIDLNLKIGDFKITGQIPVWENGHYQYRNIYKIKPKDRIKLWIYHLALGFKLNCTSNCTLKEEIAFKSFFHTQDSSITLNSVKQSENKSLLKSLLEKYRYGLENILYFFPYTSSSYAENIHKGKTEEDALLKARMAWKGSGYLENGEMEDIYYKHCFEYRDIEPLDALFKQTAQDMLLPMLDHEELTK